MTSTLKGLAHYGELGEGEEGPGHALRKSTKLDVKTSRLVKNLQVNGPSAKKVKAGCAQNRRESPRRTCWKAETGGDQDRKDTKLSKTNTRFQREKRHRSEKSLANLGSTASNQGTSERRGRVKEEREKKPEETE